MTSRRDLLLAAAARVVRRDGAAALTLDAVRVEAGVSKGGLLYHFPSKDALVVGLVEDALQRFEARVEAHRDDAPGGFTRAWVRASLDEPQDEADLAAALVAVVAAGPDAGAPILERYRQWDARMAADGLDPATVALVRYAVDGWWFGRLFGLPAPPAEVLRAVEQRLIALTGGTP